MGVSDKVDKSVLLRCEHCSGFFLGAVGEHFCCAQCEKKGIDPDAASLARRLRRGRGAIRRTLAVALVKGWELFWVVEPRALMLRAVTETSQAGVVRSRTILIVHRLATATRILEVLGDPDLARDLYDKAFVSTGWRIAGEQARNLRRLAGFASAGRRADRPVHTQRTSS